MRHRSILDPNVQTTPLDYGLLAEAMLFYGTVILVAGPGMLQSLAEKFGPELLIEYLENGYLQLRYLKNNIAIQSSPNMKLVERYAPVLYEAPHHQLDRFSIEVFRKIIGKSGRGQRLASRFLKYATSITFEETVLEDILSDFTESTYVEQSAAHIIREFVPGIAIPPGFRFRLQRDTGGLFADTNLNFSEVNRIYHSKVSPLHTSLTPALILSHLCNIRSDAYFSSMYEAEIATDSISSSLLKFKLADLLRQRNINIDAIRSFQDFVFDDAKAVSESINSGSRDFADLLPVLHKARRFKEWLKGKNPDSQLLKEYYREVMADSWTDGLPAKGVRWGIFTGLGLLLDVLGAGGVGTVAGVTLSFADAFVFDKLLHGWRPNQFVETHLKKFVE
jgi:hypothetical protein